MCRPMNISLMSCVITVFMRGIYATPMNLAVDLLWQQFVKHYCDYECQEILIADVAELIAGDAASSAPCCNQRLIAAFCQQQHEKVKELAGYNIPDRDWSAELERFYVYLGSLVMTSSRTHFYLNKPQQEDLHLHVFQSTRAS